MYIFTAFTNENILVFTAISYLTRIKNENTYVVPPMKISTFTTLNSEKFIFILWSQSAPPQLKYTPLTASNENKKAFLNS